MKRKCLFLMLLVFSCFFCRVYALDIDITGKGAILYNMNDDTIIYSKNASDKMKVASLTKIMTVVVALDYIDDLNSKVVITSNDFVGTVGYSKAGLKVGDSVTYRDLLYAILLPSGADAVNSVVNNTFGYDKFVAMMNDKASEIGMKDTYFSNPIGKDTDNYSTAYDMALLLKYALKNETFKEVFTTKEYVLTNGLKLSSTINNYKNYLNVDEIIGSKTGYTPLAGRCLASIASLNNVDYLLIVINSDVNKSYSAVKDSITIYDYFKYNYGYKELISKDTVLGNIPIVLSNKKEYAVTGSEDIVKYLKNDDNITYEYDFIEKISFRMKKGSSIGNVKIYSNDSLIATSELYLEDDIYFYPVEILGVVLVLLFILFKIKRRKVKRRRKAISA